MQDGVRRCVKFPVWAGEEYRYEVTRPWYAGEARRDRGLLVVLGDEYRIAGRIDSGTPILVVPEDIISEPAYIWVYDDKGKESNAVKLHVPKRIRDFILSEIRGEGGDVSIHQNLGETKEDIDRYSQ